MMDGFSGTNRSTSSVAEEHDRHVIAAELGKVASLLPPIPEILFKLERELSIEYLNVNRLANLIRTDPSLAGAVLKLGNSPFFRGARQITEVEEAFQRIGKDNLRSVTTMIALAKHNLPTKGLMGSQMHDFWKHAMLVAAGAVQIAKTVHKDREVLDQVWTAGLLHDMGALLAPLLYPDPWNQAFRQILSMDTDGVADSMVQVYRMNLGVDHARISGVFAEKAWRMSPTTSVLAGYWPDPATVDPPFVAWAIHRADQVAQSIGICWQPPKTRCLELEILETDSGAGPACDPAFCKASVERHIPLVEALLS